MNVKLLVIETKLEKAVDIKQALEQTRHYQVFPFADSVAALEFLTEESVDVAVVDMHMPDMPGLELLDGIRATAPEAVLIASTSSSDAAAKAIGAGAAGLVAGKYLARDVLETLQQIAPQFAPSKEETSQIPKPPAQEDVQSDEQIALFNKLAAEEPPRPSVEQGGTITAYMAKVSDDELNNLLSSLNDVIDDDDFLLDDEETQEDTPAQFILEDVADATVPLEDSSFEAYLDQVRRPQPQKDKVAEPDFLKDATFETDTMTLADEPIADIDNQQTIPFEELTPPPEDTALPTQDDSEEMWDWGNDDVDMPPTLFSDPRIARMAVSLTQASLESAADATLLTRDGEVIAYEGELVDQDINEIVALVRKDHDMMQADRGRVRFINLSSNGLDYLIYSRRTNDEFILSLVCEGDTSMTDMRQQAKRIADALDAVPDIPPEDLMQSHEDQEPVFTGEDDNSRLDAVSTPVEVGPLIKYTFVWLLEDPDFELKHATTEAINSGLRVQLVERGWEIDFLDVASDHVHIVAGIPSDEPPKSIVRNLQKRAAKIAKIVEPNINMDTLWAESYFLLTPGRPLNLQEIQQYMNFYRM